LAKNAYFMNYNAKGGIFWGYFKKIEKGKVGS
jgi:hypothetical protein